MSFSGGKRRHAELSCDWWEPQEFSRESEPRRGTCRGVVSRALSGICYMNNKHVRGKIYAHNPHARDVFSNIQYTNHNTNKKKKKEQLGYWDP